MRPFRWRARKTRRSLSISSAFCGRRAPRRNSPRRESNSLARGTNWFSILVGGQIKIAGGTMTHSGITRRQYLAAAGILLGAGFAGTRTAHALETIRQGYQTNLWGMPTYYLLRSGLL